jgi:hypothetical protein
MRKKAGAGAHSEASGFNVQPPGFDDEYCTLPATKHGGEPRIPAVGTVAMDVVSCNDPEESHAPDASTQVSTPATANPGHPIAANPLGARDSDAASENDPAKPSQK